MNDIVALDNKKTVWQAIGFYLIGTIGTLAALITIDLLFRAIPTQYRFYFGVLMAGVIPFTLSYMIATKKNLIKKPAMAALMVASLLGLLAGVFIGMIFPAILSAQPKAKK